MIRPRIWALIDYVLGWPPTREGIAGVIPLVLRLGLQGGVQYPTKAFLLEESHCR